MTLADGQVLTDPEPAELTRALGFPTELDSHEADLVVVGAGPAGLSAAVYGASEGLRTTVLDAGAVGGQAGSSSLIRNYLGFPRGLGGGELAQRAYQQAWLFGAQFRLTHRATGARAARRPARRPHRQRRRDRGTRGRARARGRVPAARRPRPDRARGRGRLLRRLDVGGAGARRRERLHRRRRQLGGAGGAPPRPLRLHGPDPRPRRRPGRDDVAVPDRHDRQGPERAGADADRGRGGIRRRPPRAAAAAHAGRDRDRARGGARRPDRRSSAHRVAAATRSPATSGATSRPAPNARAGRSTARRCRSRRACRASSRPATFAPARSSGSHRRQARARWPSATSTPTSPWSRQLDGPFTADARRPARAAAGRARDPARRARDGRAVGAPPVPLLARALDRRPERRPRVRDRRRGPPAWRPARPPRLALVSRRLRASSPCTHSRRPASCSTSPTSAS